jgi:hypothetical protein
MRTRLWMVAMVTLLTMGAARAQDPVGGTPVPVVPPVSSGGTEPSGADLFGAVGQIVVSGDLEASFSHVSFSMGDASQTSFALIPAADFFAAPNISIGGALALTHSSFDTGVPGSSSADTTGIGILVRGGYNARLGSQVSIWPRLAIGYSHTSSDTGGASASGYTVPLRIDAPILIHLAPHFFVGIGPLFQTELVSKTEGQSDAKVTVFGITTIVGGYFGPK